MRRCGPVVVVFTFIALALSFGLAAQAQERAGLSSDNSGGDSSCDCNKAGLRGPVRSVEEEQTNPPFTAGDGQVYPEFKFWKKTEYDREGRVAARWSRDSSREHGLGSTRVTRYTYNAAGQPVRMTWQKDGEADGETVYRYDDRGRLESITNSADPGNPIAFHYDAEGRKSKIAIAKPVEAPEGLAERSAASYSPNFLFEVGSGSPSLPEGGSAVTLYDEHDRPTEVQTRNANGEIIYRTIRVYDDQGHVLEEKQTMDDLLRMIPASDQKKMMDQGGVTAQELRDQIAQALGGASEMSATKYTYDANGRQTLKIQKVMGHMEQRIETSYNEHGDVAKEIWQETMRVTPDDANDETTTTTERIYSYEYDSYGNWTMKKSSSRKLPEGVSKDSAEVERRTIEYY